MVVPSKNVTVPVGVPEAVVTVAVKVTLCPNVDGLSDEVTVVVVVAGGGAFTICVIAGDVLGALLALPLYVAVILCDPVVNVAVVKVAVVPFNVPDPILVAPSKNVTVPVGVPDAVVTVAVKVTLWPNVEGFKDEVIVVVVVAGGGAFTICVMAGEVLGALLALPL